MKVLRFLGILLLILIVAFVVLGLIAPTEISTERTIVINGSKDVVKEQMFNYNNFNNWNPWFEMDTTMEWHVEGNSIDPGTKYHWKGNKDVGAGEMITKETKGDEKFVETHFLEPWESRAEAHYKVEDAGAGQTKATWGFTTHSSFPMNGLMMVMGMKKMLEKDFDKGLNNLKTYVESGKAMPPAGAASADGIQDVKFPAHNYAVVRKTMGWKDMEKFFMETYGTIGHNADKRIIGPATGLYYMWDEKAQKADVAAGFPVSGDASVEGTTMVNVPESGAFMSVLKGGYSGMYAIHGKLGEHMAKSGKQQGLVIEEYVKGPGDTQDSTKWETNIYYLYN